MKIAKIILLTLSVALTSCAVHKVYPRFTTTSELLKLSGDDTKQTVEAKLGCRAYDLFVQQRDGFSIYKWYYKRALREISAKKLMRKEGSIDGDAVLERSLSEAYLIFDEKDRLYSILTRSGRGDLLSLTLFNNDVQYLGQHRLDIWFDTETKKAIGSNGILLDYEQVIKAIDAFFEGNSDLNLQELYEMIDRYFEQ